MQAIREAILSGERDPGTFAALPIPQTYRAVTVHRDEEQMFAGLPSRDKDPRKSLHVEQVDGARARPRRGARRRDGQRDQLQHRLDVDLRAGLDLHLPAALRADLAARPAPRPALPRGRLRPVRRRPAHRRGGQRLEARRRGGRALPLGRAGARRRPQRHDARPRAADLGLRDQLRRPGRARPGQDQPADAQGRPPHLGGGRRPRPGEQHGVPAARLAQRRGHEARRRRADLGRQRRPRLLRHADGAGLRGHPRLRRLQPGEGRDLPPDGRRAGHRPQQRGLPVLEGRAHPGPARVEAVRRRPSGRSPAAATPTSSSSTRAGRRSARASTSPGAAAPSSRAPRPAASCTSTTTATCG